MTRLRQRLRSIHMDRVQALVAVVAALAVVATVAPVAVVPAAGDSPAPPGMTTVPDERTNATTDRAIGANGRAVAVGQSQGGSGQGQASQGPPEVARSKIPAQARERVAAIDESALDGAVVASDHAGSLAVDVVPTTSGSVGLILNDSTNSEGREVGIPVDVLEDALGFVPERAYGRHESGERWADSIRVVDGVALVAVPHFSTNTVTFEGTTSVTATGAIDGASYQYDVSDIDGVSNYTINVTGNTATEWDNESGTGVATTGNPSIAVGGNLDPTGPGANADPTLKVTGHGETQTPYSDENFYQSALQENEDGEFLFETHPDVINEIQFHIHSEASTVSDLTFDIYIHSGTPDYTAGEGTKVANDVTVPSGLTDSDTWNVSISEYDAPSGNITVEVVYESGTGTYELDFQQFSDGVTRYAYDGPAQSSPDHAVIADLVTYPSDLNVSTSSEKVQFGDISDGATVTKEITVPVSETDLNFSASAGTYDYTLHMKERQETVDPSVEVNGNTTSYSGTITDGTTKSLTVDTSWVQNGTNRVNVSLGSVASDAPNPVVDLQYSHGSVSNQSVDYTGGTWIEEYNLSKTYSGSQSAVDLTIPFESSVISITTIEKRINESGGWSSVASADYSLDNTTLTVDLGDVDPSTTVEVRATGSLADPINGSITVLDPSTSGDLNTRFEVDSPGTDFRLDLSGSNLSDRVHYLHDESWNASEYADVNSSGDQVLHIPDAADGDRARVSTIPLVASPDSNEVEVVVEETGEEPEVRVRPGGSTGDSVTFTWYDTVTAVEYELYSKTAGAVRDSDIAESPVTLLDDDSNELLVIRSESSSSSSSGGGSGSGSGGGGFFAGGGSLLSNPLVLALLAGVGTIVLYFLYRRFWPGSGSSRGRSGSGRSLPIRMVRRLLGNRIAMGIVAVAVTGVLVVTNAHSEGVIIFGVGSLLLLGVPLARQVIGLNRRWALVAAAIVGVLAFVAVAPSVSESFVEVAGPIAVIAVLLLGGIWLRQRSNSGPEKRINLTIRGDDDG